MICPKTPPRYENIFLYLDRLFRIIRPLFIAAFFFPLEWKQEPMIIGMHETIPKTVKIHMKSKLAQGPSDSSIWRSMVSHLVFSSGFFNNFILWWHPFFAPYFWLKGAKMNQQRARRFRAAQVGRFLILRKWWEWWKISCEEREEMEREQEKLRQDWEALDCPMNMKYPPGN